MITEEQKQAASDVAFERRMELVMQAFDQYQMGLLYYLNSLTRNVHDAEDLLQSLWRHVLLYFPEKDILNIAFLRRKAYQLFVDVYRRRQSRAETLVENYDEFELEAGHQEPCSEAEELALQQKFWSEFPGIGLSDFQRQCLWLHARHELSYSVIARKLGVGKSTVGDAVTKARSALKSYLENPNKD